ncbi:MAG: hypothetical protein WCA84_04860, partial [Ignavibacteriaceae bacterium]
MKKFLSLLITFILYYQINCYAQYVIFPYNPSKEIIQTIESEMSAKYGKKFDLNTFFIMDSLVNKIPEPWSMEKIQDPYGTLAGIDIFSCEDAKIGQDDSSKFIPDSSIIGIYKNGNIIWDSGPIIYGYIESYLSFCQDINADGIVDVGLLAQYYDFYTNNDHKTVDYLWILSWDGNNGKFINDYDVTTGKSKLIPKIFDLFDWNGDGIDEIVSSWDPDDAMPENIPPNYPYVTYGWNGNKYGLWNNVYQVKWNDFYPARWFTATINCKANKINDKFYFEYSIANNPASKQNIELIYINNINLGTIDDSSKYENDFVSLPGSLLTNAWLFAPNSYYRLIKPGEIRGGYWYMGKGLPGICDVYMQALVPHNYGLDSTKIITDNMRVADVFNNSFKAYTIGLKGIPTNFNILTFPDTILNYIEQAYQFGWIKNQSTANKYTTYFDTAISQLQQNNILGARSTLNNVLNNVNQDSSSNLTSEAYALIRYNTEYLLAQLPNTLLAVKLVNSNNNNLTTGLLQYYDSTWQNAVNNNDGTFLVNTPRKKVNLKMTYANCTQTLSNVPMGSDTVVFKTVNTSVQLLDSHGNPLDTGTVQYYAGAWQNFGTTANGIANMELLPNSYKFRMTYANASIDTQQNIGTNPNVVFQTVNTAVQLKNSLGTPIDTGTVQYYAGAWRSFGNSANGI